MSTAMLNTTRPDMHGMAVPCYVLMAGMTGHPKACKTGFSSKLGLMSTHDQTATDMDAIMLHRPSAIMKIH